MREASYEFLKSLLSTPGPSGYERAAAEIWRAEAGEFAEVRGDRMGNSFATLNGVVRGVIGKKAIHVMEADERKRVSEIKSLWIDIGAKDGDEAKGRIRVGDVAVVDQDVLELPNGRIASRSLDNRMGAFVVLEALRLLSEGESLAAEVVAVASVQEEIGLYGARGAAFGLDPDAAIAVDVTHATDTPGIPK